MAHQAAWIISVIFMVAVAVVFAVIAKHSGKQTDYAPIQKKGYFIRNIYFIVLLAVLLSAIAITMRSLPYDKEPGSGDPLVVEVNAIQFGWKMSQTKAETDQLIEFRVTSSDVNHGFGIYDADMKLVAQTQAMPGYTNVVYHTFTKPGVYQILCLEYCGLAHHYMIGEFEIGERKGGGAQ